LCQFRIVSDILKRNKGNVAGEIAVFLAIKPMVLNILPALCIRIEMQLIFVAQPNNCSYAKKACIRVVFCGFVFQL
jgi:hypothetical protein